MPEPATIAPPAAAPAAAPAPTPSPAPVTPQPSSFDKFDSDLGGGDDNTTTPAAKPAAATDPKYQRPDQRVPKPGDKPVAAPAKPADQFDPEKATDIKRLREWGRSLEKTNKELSAGRAEIEKKLQEVEARLPKTQEASEAQTKQIATLTKQLEQYESRIRLVDYQKSEEYKTKFEEPYERSYLRAYETVGELLVEEDSGEKDAEDKPILRERAATKADFDEIYQLPLGQATKLAKKKFGDAAAIVLQHRQTTRELAKNALEEIENYKTKGAELEKENQTRTATMRSAQENLWRKANEHMSADPKKKDFWGKEENDPESNKALEAGFAIADDLFNGATRQMSPEDRTIFEANIRHRIAGFSKLAYKNKALTSKITELEKIISDLRGGLPGDLNGKPADGEVEVRTNKSAMQEFDDKL